MDGLLNKVVRKCLSLLVHGTQAYKSISRLYLMVLILVVKTWSLLGRYMHVFFRCDKLMYLQIIRFAHAQGKGIRMACVQFLLDGPFRVFMSTKESYRLQFRSPIPVEFFMFRVSPQLEMRTNQQVNEFTRWPYNRSPVLVLNSMKFCFIAIANSM